MNYDNPIFRKYAHTYELENLGTIKFEISHARQLTNIHV